MKWSIVLSGLAGVVLAAIAGFGIWVAMLPPAVLAAPDPVPAEETAAIVEALRPPKRERPLIAVIGINDATETTDYLMPTGILRRADVADVVLVATESGPVELYPALTVMPDMSVAQFDAAHPEGADYVIVPAMSRDDDPAIMAWLAEQAGKGSTVIGVCAGAKVVAAAGLLENRRGTTHWFFLDALRRENPTMTYVPDRRIVVDGNVVTTTGISASIPMALTLVEAIAGRPRAEAVAAEIGFENWNAAHDSAAFSLTRPFATTVMANLAAFWQREEHSLALEPQFDAVSLAIAADAWSRTYRSRALTVAPNADAVTDREGIRILPDRVSSTNAPTATLAPGSTTPASALEGTLEEISSRYGPATAYVVAMQLEYPWPMP